MAEVAGRRGLGGVGVALLRKDQPPEITCTGLADGAQNRPIAPETVFRIASVTKTMTAIGIMQLRDRGLLDLDDPVNQFLRGLRIDVPPGGSPVTFRHLLTHTAGIGEMPRLLSFFRLASWGGGRPGTEPTDLCALYQGVLQAEVAPGSKWAYANHGFAVLGKLVEDISGERLDQYMEKHLFEPLGMDHTSYRRSERTGPQLATGHHWLFGQFRPVRDYDMTALGAGAVLSSLADMARYAAWLLEGGSDDVLQPSTLKEMASPNHSIIDGLPGNGLAFSLNDCGGHAVYGHDGNMPDFASILLVAPDTGVGVVVLTNTGTVAGANQLAWAVLREALGVPDPAGQLVQEPVIDPPQRWGRLTGFYAPAPGFLTNVRTWQMLSGEAQVVIRGRRLQLRALSMVRSIRHGLVLYRTDPADPARYAFIYEGIVVPVVFEDGADGRAECLKIGRPVNVVLYRRRAIRSSSVRLRVAGLAALALMARRRMRAR